MGTTAECQPESPSTLILGGTLPGPLGIHPSRLLLALTGVPGVLLVSYSLLPKMFGGLENFSFKFTKWCMCVCCLKKK